MNKLQALLIAGLLSLSSVSFATPVQYTPEYDLNGDQTVADGNQAGTIYVDQDTTHGFTGNLAGDKINGTGRTSAYFDIVMGSGIVDIVTFGQAYDTVQPNSLVYSFFDAAGNSFNTAYENLSGTFNVALAANTTYRLVLTGDEGYAYDGRISAVPVPAAGILFASALFGAGALGRRKKKAKASVVGAFARAS